MKTNVHAFSDFTLRAKDAELGKIKDLYFDATTWQVRYLVVDTRKWLPGRKVLLAPEAIEHVDLGARRIQLKLTRKEVELAPPLEEHLPVTRQHQTALNHYYGWTPYWMAGSSLEFSSPMPAYMHLTEGLELPPADGETFQPQVTVDPHLQSLLDTEGYTLLGRSDAPAGSVEDLIIDCHEWTVPFVVAERHGAWFHARRILVPTSHVTAVEWRERAVRSSVGAEQLEDAPAYDEQTPLDARFERAVTMHFSGTLSAPVAPPVSPPTWTAYGI